MTTSSTTRLSTARAALAAALADGHLRVGTEDTWRDLTGGRFLRRLRTKIAEACQLGEPALGD